MKKSVTERGGVKSVLIVGMLRLSQRFTGCRILRIIGMPVRLFYRLFSRNLMHVEILDTTQVGEGLILWHGAHGSVINPQTVIGKNLNLRQGTTIGSSSFTDASLCPTIGNNVQIGSNCTILGKITIGDNAMIGGGSVVVKNVPANAVVAGNPAHVIRILVGGG